MDGARENGRRSLRLVAGGVTPRRPPTPSAARDEDDALAAAFLVGDRGVLDGLVRSNAATVLAVVRRYARVPQDARELAQEAFRRAFVSARRALGRDPQRAVPFRPWLVRDVLKLAMDHLRHEVCLAGARLEQLGPADAPPSAGCEGGTGPDRATRIRKEVLQLPRRQREVLTLRIDAELPFTEIATVLRITETAAALNFHLAARTLLHASDAGARDVSACPAYDALLSLRAAGALERAASARVEAHLAGCSGCGAVADETAEALALATLAPAAAQEPVAVEDLAAAAVRALERSERRRLAARRLVITLAVAAASALALAAEVLAGYGGAP
jgi:RNA polymerase sigma-70 factor (ECF subfamily)